MGGRFPLRSLSGLPALCLWKAVCRGGWRVCAGCYLSSPRGCTLRAGPGARQIGVLEEDFMGRERRACLLGSPPAGDALVGPACGPLGAPPHPGLCLTARLSLLVPNGSPTGWVSDYMFSSNMLRPVSFQSTFVLSFLEHLSDGCCSLQPMSSTLLGVQAARSGGRCCWEMGTGK